MPGRKLKINAYIFTRFQIQTRPGYAQVRFIVPRLFHIKKSIKQLTIGKLICAQNAVDGFFIFSSLEQYFVNSE